MLVAAAPNSYAAPPVVPSSGAAELVAAATVDGIADIIVVIVCAVASCASLLSHVIMCLACTAGRCLTGSTLHDGDVST